MTIEIGPEIERILQTEARRKGLSPDKIVQTVLEEKFTPQKVSRELLHEMAAEGMISRIPEGISDTDDDFEPIEINGKPLSETLLEDRN